MVIYKLFRFGLLAAVTAFALTPVPSFAGYPLKFDDLRTDTTITPNQEDLTKVNTRYPLTLHSGNIREILQSKTLFPYNFRDPSKKLNAFDYLLHIGQQDTISFLYSELVIKNPNAEQRNGVRTQITDHLIKTGHSELSPIIEAILKTQQYHEIYTILKLYHHNKDIQNSILINYVIRSFKRYGMPAIHELYRTTSTATQTTPSHNHSVEFSDYIYGIATEQGFLERTLFYLIQNRVEKNAFGPLNQFFRVMKNNSFGFDFKATYIQMVKKYFPTHQRKLEKLYRLMKRTYENHRTNSSHSESSSETIGTRKRDSSLMSPSDPASPSVASPQPPKRAKTARAPESESESESESSSDSDSDSSSESDSDSDSDSELGTSTDTESESERAGRTVVPTGAPQNAALPVQTQPSSLPQRTAPNPLSPLVRLMQKNRNSQLVVTIVQSDCKESDFCEVYGEMKPTLLLALEYGENELIFNELIQQKKMKFDQITTDGKTIRHAVVQYLLKSEKYQSKRIQILESLFDNTDFLPETNLGEMRALVQDHFLALDLSVNDLIQLFKTRLFKDQPEVFRKFLQSIIGALLQSKVWPVVLNLIVELRNHHLIDTNDFNKVIEELFNIGLADGNETLLDDILNLDGVDLIQTPINLRINYPN